jgi:hypothetical protein
MVNKPSLTPDALGVISNVRKSPLPSDVSKTSLTLDALGVMSMVRNPPLPSVVVGATVSEFGTGVSLSTGDEVKRSSPLSPAVAETSSEL